MDIKTKKVTQVTNEIGYAAVHSFHLMEKAGFRASRRRQKKEERIHGLR